MNSRKRNKHKRRPRTRQSGGGERGQGNLKAAVSSNINGKPYSLCLRRGLIMPDRYITSLEFVDTTNTNFTSVGAAFAQKKYRPTSAYDVDPVLGSTGTAGFTELSAFYAYYRVLSYRPIIECINQETFGVTAYIITTNTDPGTLSGSQALAYQMNPNVCRRLLGGSASQNHCCLQQMINCERFVGSAMQKFDDNYRSSVVTVPNNNIFTTLVLLSNGSSVFGTNGVCVNVRFILQVEFFERVPLVA
jgi:hypothetical protein